MIGVESPTVVGEPEMTTLAPSVPSAAVTPSGNPLALVNVYGGVPPLIMMVPVAGWPTTSSGSGPDAGVSVSGAVAEVTCIVYDPVTCAKVKPPILILNSN